MAPKTTLSSAGGISLVVNDTDPVLEIKGITGGAGIKVNSSSTTLPIRLKTASETLRFSDDFFYHTNGTSIDLEHATNPFMKSTFWTPESSSGVGLDMVQTQEWPGGGNGVVKFINSVRTGAGSWTLKAKNNSIYVTGGETIFETAVYFETPSTNGWQFKIGLLSPSVTLLGFDINPTSNSYLQTVTPAGTTGTTVTVSSLMNQWNIFKIVVNASLTSVQFYLNGTLINTRTSLSNTYYIPVIYSSRSATMTSYNFYIDYMEVTKDPR